MRTKKMLDIAILACAFFSVFFSFCAWRGVVHIYEEEMPAHSGKLPPSVADDSCVTGY